MPTPDLTSATASEPALELIELNNGARSLRWVGTRETFHPVVGPMIEANAIHVEQQRLVERARELGRLIVWDIGLGAAANAIAALSALQNESRIEIHSFDRSRVPLEFALSNAEALGYMKGFEPAVRDLLATGRAQPAAGIEWFFHEGDFSQILSPTQWPAPHAVLFDPYSPKPNPDMWTLPFFERLHQSLPKDELCLLTNYTCSTAVRVTLLLAGFHVGQGVGVGEKTQTTIASNRIDGLVKSLDKQWLERVRRSHSAAPLRQAPYTTGAISDEDYNRLCRSEQFT